jgi:hypothetical protein
MVVILQKYSTTAIQTRLISWVSSNTFAKSISATLASVNDDHPKLSKRTGSS